MNIILDNGPGSKSRFLSAGAHLCSCNKLGNISIFFNNSKHLPQAAVIVTGEKKRLSLNMYCNYYT